MKNYRDRLCWINFWSSSLGRPAKALCVITAYIGCAGWLATPVRVRTNEAGYVVIHRDGERFPFIVFVEDVSQMVSQLDTDQILDFRAGYLVRLHLRQVADIDEWIEFPDCLTPLSLFGLSERDALVVRAQASQAFT